MDSLIETPFSNDSSQSRDSYWCSKGETIAAVEHASNNASIILDFDETLFLRNSTEAYLNSIEPRLLGAMLLFLLSFLKPWRWLPKGLKGDISQDWLRVVIATIVFPWTPILWRMRARTLAERYINAELLQALENSNSANLIVASNGFQLIIRPILSQLNLPIQQVIACRFWSGGRDRQRGKKALLIDAVGESALEQAIVVTDSEDDLPLLAAVAKPCLTLWPGAKYERAMGNFYIPFFYTERVKQPGEKYLIKVIVAEDLLFAALATSWLSPNPLLHGAGLGFLMAAFWCIYEIGYMENDRVAETLEDSPKLSKNYRKYKSRMNLWQPWIWAILFSFPGVVLLQAAAVASLGDVEAILTNLLHPDLAQVLSLLGKWIAFLAIVRLTFWVYNYVNKPTRVWLYPFLQVYKCFGFLVITSTNLVGSMFFVAQSLSRWMVYLVYRYSKGSWNKVGQILRWLMFSVLILALALGNQDWSFLTGWQTIVIFLYAGLKARREIMRVVKDFGLIAAEAS